MVFRESSDRAVVHDRSVVARQKSIPDAPGTQVGEPVRVYEIEKLGCVFPLHIELAERAHVDDADALPDRHCLGLRVAIAMGTLPASGLGDRSVSLHVSLMNRRSLEGHVHRPGQFAEGEGLDGRA